MFWKKHTKNGAFVIRLTIQNRDKLTAEEKAAAEIIADVKAFCAAGPNNYMRCVPGLIEYIAFLQEGEFAPDCVAHIYAGAVEAYDHRATDVCSYQDIGTAMKRKWALKAAIAAGLLPDPDPQEQKEDRDAGE